MKKERKEPRWPIIKDARIVHEWRCPGCKATAQVGPAWYQDNGTPMCTDCDEDMEYLRTRIKPVRAIVHVSGGVAYEPARVPKYVTVVIRDHDNERDT